MSHQVTNEGGGEGTGRTLQQSVDTRKAPALQSKKKWIFSESASPSPSHFMPLPVTFTLGWFPLPRASPQHSSRNKELICFHCSSQNSKHLQGKGGKLGTEGRRQKVPFSLLKYRDTREKFCLFQAYLGRITIIPRILIHQLSI